jgi:hypothetical protein
MKAKGRFKNTPLFQDREVLIRMLAAVVLISEIEFEEDNRGAAQIKDVAPFAHGNY